MGREGQGEAANKRGERLKGWWYGRINVVFIQNFLSNSHVCVSMLESFL